ncbi:MAG TPA: hypothetical protein VLA33_04360 [Gemmatimonadota bacterium]|nr:hypothetical protein [Gemmatimonadota bacterium]
MNGRRFVVLLALLAIACVTLIVLGIPTWGGAEVTAETGETNSVAVPPAPDVGVIPALATAVDSGSTVSADTAGAWAYRRTAVADLDGDAVPERLVVASDVFVTDDGEPLWDDIHRWAVYVEEDDGARTLVYSAFAPPGGVSVAVGVPAETGRRRIVVVEQGPRRGRLLLAAYAGVGRVDLVAAAGEQLEVWVERVVEDTE